MPYADPEKAREKRREYDAANRERIRERFAAYYAANRERLREKRREYVATNRERIRESNAAYEAANPHIRWAKRYRRRAKEFGFPAVVEAFTRDFVVARYGEACFNCGGAFEELDHFPVPVVSGGPHTLDNVKPSCQPCNAKQGPTLRRDRAGC